MSGLGPFTNAVLIVSAAMAASFVLNMPFFLLRDMWIHRHKDRYSPVAWVFILAWSSASLAVILDCVL